MTTAAMTTTRSPPVPDMRCRLAQVFGSTATLKCRPFRIDPHVRIRFGIPLRSCHHARHSRRFRAPPPRHVTGYHCPVSLPHRAVAARLNCPACASNLDQATSPHRRFGSARIPLVVRDGMQVTEFPRRHPPWALQHIRLVFGRIRRPAAIPHFIVLESSACVDVSGRLTLPTRTR